jgi:hypothetical protein
MGDEKEKFFTARSKAARTVWRRYMNRKFLCERRTSLGRSHRLGLCASER